MQVSDTATHIEQDATNRPAIGWVRQFAKSEDGAIVGFAVFIFLLILMIGGIAIDVMNSEVTRTKMQHTLDRAVLAAADLDQKQDPKTVVNDYFDKSGLKDTLGEVTVDKGLNYRTVTATATGSVDTMFMKMVGIDTLSMPASGTAEERIGDVEISMVLDVSGSMGSNSRLTNLKTAAKEFITTMDENTDDGRLSISIVPYATQVSAPEEFFKWLYVSPTGNPAQVVDPDEEVTSLTSNRGQQPQYSRCINFESDDYKSTAVYPQAEYQHSMHFDPWNDSDGRDNDPKHLVPRPVCEDDSRREMMIMQKNSTALKSFITNLWAGGNTSIDIGMKWGAALLDPKLRPVIAKMSGESHVPTEFSIRPFDFDSGDSLKVIVLMTDGQNTSQYYIHDDFRTGESNIWWNDQEEIYSVYVGLDEYDEDNDGVYDEPLFYWPTTDTWEDHAYGEGVYEETVSTRVCKSYKRNGSCKRYKTVKTIETVDEPGEAKLLSYEDLYAYTTLEWIVEDLYEPWMYDDDAWDDWYYAVRKSVGSTTKNLRTKYACDAAKAKGMIVFSIGFEAPSSGQAVLKDCASSASHYFDVDGLEIRDAFAAIASSIRQLRLTQ
nr:TadE/TadG family type IV pilus assembly protein [uncultured Shimia sp.]